MLCLFSFLAAVVVVVEVVVVAAAEVVRVVQGATLAIMIADTTDTSAMTTGTTTGLTGALCLHYCKVL